MKKFNKKSNRNQRQSIAFYLLLITCSFIYHGSAYASQQEIDMDKCYPEFENKPVTNSFDMVGHVPQNAYSRQRQIELNDTLEKLAIQALVSNCNAINNNREPVSSTWISKQLDREIARLRATGKVKEFEKSQMILLIKTFSNNDENFKSTQDIKKLTRDMVENISKLGRWDLRDSQGNYRNQRNFTFNEDTRAALAIAGLGFLGYSIVNSMRSSESTGSGSSYVPCNSNDDCFNVVSRNKNNTVKIMCIKGSKKDMEQCIATRNDGKWASGCSLADAFAYHYSSMRTAGNQACQ